MNKSSWQASRGMFFSFGFARGGILLLLLTGAMLALSSCSGPPQAVVAASVTSGAAPLTVTFTNTSKNADSFRWDFGDGATLTTAKPEDPASHQYTKAGTLTVTLTAANKEQTSTATTTITIQPGEIAKAALNITTAALTPQGEQGFSVSAADQFDNVITDADITYISDAAAGKFDAQGKFTAATKAGSYPNAIVVQVKRGAVAKTLTAGVTVNPGPLDHVTLSPVALSLAVAKDQQVAAAAFDQFGNPILGLTYTYKAASPAGQVDGQGKFTAATKTGAYSGAVTVEALQGAITKSASADITLLPGPLDRVSIQPASPSVQVTKSQQFTATALDQFGNTIPDATITFRASAQAGQVSNQGAFTAGTKSGSYQDAVTVEAVQGAITKSTSALITVNPGPLAKIALSPASATLDIGATQDFKADVTDTYGNPISNAQVTWSAAEGAGTVTSAGHLTAGTKAGTYAQGVTATATQGAVTQQGSSSITVKPGPLDGIAIGPALIRVAAGATQQLSASGADKYGNPLGSVQVTWSVLDANAGAVSSTGVLTARQVARTFAGAVQARGTLEGQTKTTTAAVTIIPTALNQVVMAPGSINLGMGMTQQYVAVGADKYGNRISGLTFTYSLAAGGGTLDAKGLFTAGATPGAYANTVKVSTTQGDISKSATASVTVEADRILFFSTKDNSAGDLYLMNFDGTNVQRVTTGNTITTGWDWAPSGRRFAYDDLASIYFRNDDGTGDTRFAGSSDIQFYFLPTWSPDGRKVAFIGAKPLPGGTTYRYDLYVADIDGGNLRLLTDTLSDTETSPSWSPDGTKIVYAVGPSGGKADIWVINVDNLSKQQLVNNPATDGSPVFSPDGKEIAFTSDRDGDAEIYLMNADGSNVRQLTVNTVTDEEPSWSPDGARIAFDSRRDGNFEIYIMNRDGSNQTRVTNNSAIDANPRWGPKKTGVLVSEASVVIPNASALQPLTSSAVTAKVRSAVVKIDGTIAGGSVGGSGVLIDANGFILTANHVIAKTTSITVTLDNGTSYPATVKGRDMVRDVAVIKIEATNLPFLELGDISNLALAGC